ncbi:MAG: excinuclease ABC subunit UvrC, partial [Lachnospiraceae bacterium]|nr:excinuclease ABC subunit UvrC [Lachnospiraceae bacterium]
EEELSKLPAKPGVYIMHDENDTIIYVGKAVILKNRVRSYFRESTKKTLKIQQMVTHINWFEYVVTDSELEALVLENNLIKEHQPKYNTLLKDDKTYPYIKVTVGEDFPRILFTRLVRNDKSKYFGPYTSATSVKETIEYLKKRFGIRNCNRAISEAKDLGENCLYYHIHMCQAPCMRKVTKEEYGEKVAKVLEFLNGTYKPVLMELKSEMQRYSDEMEFEKAAKTRDLLFSIQQVCQKQKITDTQGEDKDIIALARDKDSVIIQAFFVREGKIIGREHFYMKNTEDTSDNEIVKSFIEQFYAGTPFVPKEVIVPLELEDRELLESWLSSKGERAVHITVPKKGKKEKLVELAEKNAQIVLNQDIDKIKREEARTKGAVHEIEALLGIDGLSRMEAFDISNISGFNSVGSMVVYEDGKPKKNDYRKFRIKTVDGPNDYASMREVLTRRFTHGLEEQKNREEGQERFSKFPDLLLMDGGRGQVNIAEEVLLSLGLSIPVCGMVKDDNHRTRGLYFQNEEIPISKSSEGFKLITRIQDEAHRFAIEYHRSLRSNSQVHSILDDIPNIGKTRRLAIMKYFESIEELKKATVDELKEVPGMDARAAKSVYDFFKEKGTKNESS